MACEIPKPFYLPWTKPGIKVIDSCGDGYTMLMSWFRAFPDPASYNIAYNIYYSTIPPQIETEFIPTIDEGPKFVSVNTEGLGATVVDFTPGDTYYFIIRATQYDPDWYDLTQLSQDDSQIDMELFRQADQYLYIYPETLLSADMTIADDFVPITDIELFPDRGVVKVGIELIRYESRDLTSGYLTDVTRGFFETDIRFHDTDGYDGYETHDPIVRFWKGIERPDLYLIQEQSTFNEPHNIYTIPDGYYVQDREGILMPDLDQNDSDREDFPPYDFVGWRRTDPKRLFVGSCVDSYIGGENFCADGYHGINQQIRGIPLFEQADRLQEALLEQLGTGDTCVLLRRLWKGITCNCYHPNQEYPDARCSKCFGTGFITGYEQYYNPRRLDGRILVRFSPATEDIKMEDAGMENNIIFPCWTLTYPALDDRDIIIRFNPDGTEEYRYEILDVERNRLLFGQTGNQHFRAQRVRKTSMIYQWRAIRSTADAPVTLSTTVGLLRGPNNVPIPHIHTLNISNNTLTLSQINQTTDFNEGHNHYIINGEVNEVLGHTHNIIL
jgi:hypothetical protein